MGAGVMISQVSNYLLHHLLPNPRGKATKWKNDIIYCYHTNCYRCEAVIICPGYVCFMGLLTQPQLRIRIHIDLYIEWPDPYQSKKQDPYPHISNKQYPDPHQSEEQDPDSHQSEK